MSSLPILGQDAEGRAITYDPSDACLYIGGMRTTIERLEAMSAAGQLEWQSQDIAQWAKDSADWDGKQNREREAAVLVVQEERLQHRRAGWKRVAAGVAVLVVIALVASVSWSRWRVSPTNITYDYLEAEASNDWPAMVAIMDMEAVIGHEFDRQVATELASGANPAAVTLAATLKPAFVQRQLAQREQEVRKTPVSSRGDIGILRLARPRPKQAGLVGDNYQVMLELRNPANGTVRPVRFTLENTESGWRIIDVQE